MVSRQSMSRSRYSRHNYRFVLIKFGLGTRPDCEDNIDGGSIGTVDLDLKYRFLVRPSKSTMQKVTLHFEVEDVISAFIYY